MKWIRGHRRAKGGDTHLRRLRIQAAVGFKLLKRDREEGEAEELLVETIDVGFQTSRIYRSPVGSAHGGAGGRKRVVSHGITGKGRRCLHLLRCEQHLLERVVPHLSPFASAMLLAVQAGVWVDDRAPDDQALVRR